ncbi:PDR/VanB family oxidoreductase [Pararhodobacter oceanensis]|uniref:PDR/VanB family oxidoreductase n=1 Tax=Pararhodobacter oceanensis TaxID=2172121 RepID=UPI003A8F7B4A
MKLDVLQRRALTPQIMEFTLAAADRRALPAAEAGAHITLQTPSGAMRRYSLVHPAKAPEAYVVAVKREPQSRGGSASMHDAAQVGQVLDCAPPENAFALGAEHPALLIAGGIGITPIYAMAQQLAAEGRAFRLVYCARDAQYAAYAAELQALCGARLTLHCDAGDPENAFDFWDICAEPTAEHIYCCGPAPLMEEVRAVTGHWPEGRVHFEDFKPVEVVRADDRPFMVTLQRSGQEILVPADRSILEALRDAGHPTVSSCESGTCGTCKCGLLAGTVDHRDRVLMEDQKQDHIMICVSRAAAGHLVVDL